MNHRHGQDYLFFPWTWNYHVKFPASAKWSSKYILIRIAVVWEKIKITNQLHSYQKIKSIPKKSFSFQVRWTGRQIMSEKFMMVCFVIVFSAKVGSTASYLFLPCYRVWNPFLGPIKEARLYKKFSTWRRTNLKLTREKGGWNILYILLAWSIMFSFGKFQAWSNWEAYISPFYMFRCVYSTACLSI